MNPKTPKEFAKDCIRRYVLDDYPLDFLCNMGGGWKGYNWEIRGVSENKIRIVEFEGKEVDISFNLKQLYQEILDERIGQQITLI